jgi:hypothetical protein
MRRNIWHNVETARAKQNGRPTLPMAARSSKTLQPEILASFPLLPSGAAFVL